MNIIVQKNIYKQATHVLTSTKAQNKVQSGLLLNVVITQSAAILKLLSSKDETLLVWGNSHLVLNLLLNVFNTIAGLNIK